MEEKEQGEVLQTILSWHRVDICGITFLKAKFAQAALEDLNDISSVSIFREAPELRLIIYLTIIRIKSKS